MTDDRDESRDERGCPVCEWDGEVDVTHDGVRRYYHHLIVKNGHVFIGSTCSERTRPDRPSLMDRLLGRVFG